MTEGAEEAPSFSISRSNKGSLRQRSPTRPVSVFIALYIDSKQLFKDFKNRVYDRTQINFLN